LKFSNQIANHIAAFQIESANVIKLQFKSQSKVFIHQQRRSYSMSSKCIQCFRGSGTMFYVNLSLTLTPTFIIIIIISGFGI